MLNQPIQCNPMPTWGSPVYTLLSTQKMASFTPKAMGKACQEGQSWRGGFWDLWEGVAQLKALCMPLAPSCTTQSLTYH